MSELKCKAVHSFYFKIEVLNYHTILPRIYFSIHSFIQPFIHLTLHKHLVCGRLWPRQCLVIILPCTQVSNFLRDSINYPLVGVTQVDIFRLQSLLCFYSSYSLYSHFPIYEWRGKKKPNSTVNSLSDRAKFSWLWRTCPPDSMHHVPKVIRATYLKLTI